VTQRTPCPHFPRCVGCPWIGTPYREQLARKEARVQQALGRFASLGSVEIPPLRPAPRVFGYRSSVRLVARRGREGMRLGVYRPGSHDVVDIRQCAAHHRLANALLETLAGILERQRVPCYDEGTRQGWLRYVQVRVGSDGRTLLLLVVRDRDFAGEGALVAELSRLRGVAGVLLNLNADPGNAILGPEFVCVAGEDSLTERGLGLELRTHAGSFAQSNPAAARRAYACVLRDAAAQPGERAVDLYCGVGALALALARQGAQVLGVEEVPRAVEDARANAERNAVHGVRFEAADVEASLRRLVREGAHVDLVTLNPPRRGADAAAREAIAALAPSRIVYMSCDPDSLARDLDDFAARGFPALRVQAFDFLPHTEHVEAVALLRATPR
jgi:23S rRNA (uracil1939-C5)-methyltransferase